MQGLVKKHPTKGVAVQLGNKKHARLFLVPKEMAKGLVHILHDFEVSDHEEQQVSARDLFPDLNSDTLRPAAALRGARQKEALSQEKLAEQLGIKQGDLSKMERGVRPIGKKMAVRLSKVLNIDYRVFL